MLLLFSARTKDDMLFSDELAALRDRRDGFDLITTLTRAAQPPPRVLKGRIDRSAIEAALSQLPDKPRRVYICGSNPFVENAAQHAIDAGVEPMTIATERYGV
jgi:ferredoxin-NADP reductase